MVCVNIIEKSNQTIYKNLKKNTLYFYKNIDEKYYSILLISIFYFLFHGFIIAKKIKKKVNNLIFKKMILENYLHDSEAEE